MLTPKTLRNAQFLAAFENSYLEANLPTNNLVVYLDGAGSTLISTVLIPEDQVFTLLAPLGFGEDVSWFWIEDYLDNLPDESVRKGSLQKGGDHA